MNKVNKQAGGISNWIFIIIVLVLLIVFFGIDILGILHRLVLALANWLRGF